MAQPARRKSNVGDIDWIVLSYRTVGKWLLITLLVPGAPVLGYVLYQQNHETPVIPARRPRQVGGVQAAAGNLQRRLHQDDPNRLGRNHVLRRNALPAAPRHAFRSEDR